LFVIKVFCVSCILGILGALAPVSWAGEELIPETDGHHVEPAAREPTQSLIDQLKVAPGFKVSVFALGVGKPRMMAMGPGGIVYVTRREPGDVVALPDLDADGTAERVEPVVKDLPGAHGITIHDGKMYVATVRDVYVAELKPNGKVGEMKKLVEGLPEGGRHPNRTLAVGPDEKLYVTVGSSCNCCIEEDQESASILRVDLKTGKREVWCEGLRNTLGFGWHPKTKVCWGMDHGSDWLGDEFPPEELNKLEKGKHYGWPLLHGENVLDPKIQVPEGVDVEKWKAKSTPMTLGYLAHAAPMQMVFYSGKQFPKAYRNDAFVAMHGSWNSAKPVGYEVVRIKFDENGKPTAMEPFVSGWLLDGPAQFGRPCGLAVAQDGALLISDDAQGVIYRVSYDPKRVNATRPTP
jgi:glucose/arabinose dehydrogenase